MVLLTLLIVIVPKNLFRSGVLMALLALLPSLVHGAEDKKLLEELVHRPASKGLITEDELKALGLGRVALMRSLNRREAFLENVEGYDMPTTMTVLFHRDLYHFLTEEDHEKDHGVSAELKSFHIVGAAIRPDGEVAVSQSSSAAMEAALGYAWQGRETQEGTWKCEIGLILRDHEREALDAFDLLRFNAAAGFSKDEWRYGLGLTLDRYGPTGSDESGAFRTSLYVERDMGRFLGPDWGEMTLGLQLDVEDHQKGEADNAAGESRDRQTLSLLMDWQLDPWFFRQGSVERALGIRLGSSDSDASELDRTHLGLDLHWAFKPEGRFCWLSWTGGVLQHLDQKDAFGDRDDFRMDWTLNTHLLVHQAWDVKLSFRRIDAQSSQMEWEFIQETLAVQAGTTW